MQSGFATFKGARHQSLGAKPGSAEEFAQLFVPECEDAADVGSDEQLVDDGAAENGIGYLIADGGEAFALDEGVLVVPKTVGATELVVYKPVGWFPGGDFAFPADGDAVKLEAILDARARGHADGLRREDMEIEPGRSERFEIAGVRKEAKHFIDATLEQKLGFKRKNLHG